MAIVLTEQFQGIRFGDVDFLDGKTQATFCLCYNADFVECDSFAQLLHKAGAWAVCQRNSANPRTRSVVNVPSQTSMNPGAGTNHASNIWVFYALVIDRSLSNQRARIWRRFEADESLSLIASNDLNDPFTFLDIEDELRIGTNHAESGEQFVGMIRDCAILDVPLSSAELMDISEDFSEVLTYGSNLVWAAPLDYDARDVSGNGNDGTTFGDPTFTEEPPGDDEDRDAHAHTERIVARSTRTGTGQRDAQAHTGRIVAAADRRGSGQRDTAAHVRPIVARADRSGTGARDTGAHVGQLVAWADWTTTADRDAQAHARPIVARSDRSGTGARDTRAHGRQLVAAASRQGTGVRAAAAGLGRIVAWADWTDQPPPLVPDHLTLVGLDGRLTLEGLE